MVRRDLLAANYIGEFVQIILSARTIVPLEDGLIEAPIIVAEAFKNVKFSTKSGHTVQDMRDIINARQDQTGKKIKLISSR